MKATSHLKGYGLAILVCVIAFLVAWPTRANVTALMCAVLLSEWVSARLRHAII